MEKNMEFHHIYMEKSWKKILPFRAFHPILTHCLGYFKDILDKIIFGYLCQIITGSTF